MHIFEGFLPGPWWQIWFAISIPVIFFGMYRMNKLISERRELLPLLAVAGAFIFVLSSLKLPSVTGSSSHPTGTGMAAILFGPAITAVLGTIVLLYQSLFLAHGGFTTLGANVASMGIIGPVVAYVIYKAGMKANMNFYVVVFLATAFADWATYVVTSIQLALAFPAEVGGSMASFQAFAAIFATTQVPLAIMEGALTALVFKYIVQVKSDALVELKVITAETVEKLRGVVA
ncbi:cobalt/nickel transport system permease protein [Methanohalophilus levihalophilus]|uniref:energy-coupling factor ABC transporter permease n=1 Tax=Methanohalophilus levihalophilus TaxID=1431282 RepID=UPI001AE533A0|nr:energy-coupling factor ABC transporter permease [Methanohalophilus levihalophilus]MBP2029890.1 cobalt/nickel transport system permease protein [Methanohalophilus levihalophilus]